MRDRVRADRMAGAPGADPPPLDASGPALSGALPLVELLARTRRPGKANAVADRLAASPRHEVEAGLARAVIAAFAGNTARAFRLAADALSGDAASVSHFNWAIRFVTQQLSPEQALEIVEIGRPRFPGPMEAQRRTLLRTI